MSSITKPDPDLWLSDLLDPDSLQRVCATFAQLYLTGVLVVDRQGRVLRDAVPPGSALCRWNAEGGARPQWLCAALEKLACSPEEPDGSGPALLTCPCGMSFLRLQIRHQGSRLGCLLLGPVKHEGWDPVRLEAMQAAGGDKPAQGVLAAVARSLRDLPSRPEWRMRQEAQAMQELMAELIKGGYTRHLTSRIHIAAIEQAYNELSEKNRRLADSVEKLKDLDRLKSNFLATISHELRTPLTSIIGYSEMLLEGLAGALDKTQHEYVQIIVEKGEQLLQIISEVLDLSRIETGRMELSRERVSLSPLVRAVVSSMMLQIRSKEISLSCTLPEDLPTLWVDPAKVRQVLVNLLSNAIKFTPRRGRVDLSARGVPRQQSGPGASPAGSDHVLIRVQDSGIGIPERCREKIFEAFYQVDSSSTRQYGGTGLGLAIVKNFVEAHGGRVWMEPAADSGTVFLVQLPVHTPAQCRIA